MMLLKASCCASPGDYHDPVSHMMANESGSKPAVLLAPSPSTWKDGSCPTWYPASPSSALTGSFPPLFAPSALRHWTQAKLRRRSDGLLPDGSRAVSGVPSSTIVVSSSTSSNSSGRHSDHGFGGEGGPVDATELWSGADAEIQSAGVCGEKLPVANAPHICAQDDTANVAKSQAEAAVKGSVEPSGLRADCGSMLSSSSSDLLNDAARCEGCGGDAKAGSTGEAARPSHVLEMLSAAVQQQEFVVVGGDDARHTTECAPAAVHVGSNHHVPQPAARLQSGGSHVKRQCNPPPLPAMGLKLADIKRVIGLKTAPPTKKPRKGESVSPSSAAAHHATGTSSLAHRLAAVLPAHAQHHSAKPPLPQSCATLSDVPVALHAVSCSPCADAPSALACASGASLPRRGGEALDDVAHQMQSWPGRAMNCASPAGGACGGGLNCTADCNGHMAKAHGPLPCAHSPDGAAEPVCAGCVGMAAHGVAQGDAMLMCPGCTPSSAMAPGSDGPWPTAAGHYHPSSHQHADMLGLEARLAGALGAEAAGPTGMVGMAGTDDGRDASGLCCSADGLAERGVGGAMGTACEKVDDERDVKRKESNRVSARKSRQRRQLQMERLEAEAVQLRDTNAALLLQAQEAETRVEELIGQQRELQRQCEAARRQLEATHCQQEDA
ncbi:unnamed protein product [Closterium sp. Yama58-4]|nr:unnamed protein product [Closterium sp. Yama58-4]